MSRAERIEAALLDLLTRGEGCITTPPCGDCLWCRAAAALAQPATGGDEYRRGVEDAARVVGRIANGVPRSIESVRLLTLTADAVLALSPPPAPTPVEEP